MPTNVVSRIPADRTRTRSESDGPFTVGPRGARARRSQVLLDADLLVTTLLVHSVLLGRAYRSRAGAIARRFA